MKTKKEMEQGIMLIEKALDLLQNKPVGKKLLDWSRDISDDNEEDWYNRGIEGLREARIQLKGMLRKCG